MPSELTEHDHWTHCVFAGGWHGKQTVLWPGIRITSNDLILVDHCYRIIFTTNSLSGISIWVLRQWYGFCFWIKPDKPAKKNTFRMGIFGWPSASFSAATPRRFSAVSCASKEATTMDSSDATWHQTTTPVYSRWLSIRDWTAQNPPHLLFWLQLLLASANGISKNYKTTELKHGETMWKPFFPCHWAIPQSLMA